MMRYSKNLKKLFATGLLAICSMVTMAQKPTDIILWPDGAPHSNGDGNDQAMVRVYLPDKKVATGRAVVICPGGGYQHLAMEHEGYDWATFFNQEGIAAIVLKYRMPHGDKRVPVEDAEEAIKLVRRNADSWHINPDDIGIMGSSAGGHLASTIATHSVKEAKPNFQILFYPVITMMPDITHKGSHDNFLGSEAKKKDEREYSNDSQVTRVTPRAWIALSDDDHSVLPANGVNYYTELYRHDVPASLHVYPSGGHGWGFRSSFKYHIEMLLELKAWLKSF
jgi:acetyl esterase/lipase